MNRKLFFRNLAGLIGVAASAKELASLPPSSTPKAFEYVIGVDPAIPGTQPVAFRIFLNKDWLAPNDLITVGPERIMYHIREDHGNYHRAALVTKYDTPNKTLYPKEILLFPNHMRVDCKDQPVVDRVCSALPL